MSFNGVIDTSGDLIRAGFTDFSNMLESGQSQRSDAPFPSFVKGNSDNNHFHRWTGTEWILIEKESAILNRWELHNTGKDYKFIRQKIIETVQASGWTNLQQTEKELASRWFAVPQNLRSEVFSIEQQILIGMRFHTESIKARYTRFTHASMEVYNRLPKSKADEIVFDIENDGLAHKYIEYGREGINSGDPEGLFDYMLATSGTSYAANGIAAQDINPSGMNKTQFINKLIDIVGSGNYP